MSAEKKTVKFVYQGKLRPISCPANATYETAIELALHEFAIPIKCKDFVRIKSGGKYPITKAIFEGQLEQSSTPDLDFHIQVGAQETAEERNFIRFVHRGDLERVYYSVTDTYDDIIDLAFQRFSIPSKFKEFMRLSSGGRYPVTPETFQHQLELWPTPEMEFHIQMDKAAIARSSGAAAVKETKTRTLTTKRPRASDEKPEQHSKRQKTRSGRVDVAPCATKRPRPCDEKPEQEAKRQKTKRSSTKSG